MSSEDGSNGKYASWDDHVEYISHPLKKSFHANLGSGTRNTSNWTSWCSNPASILADRHWIVISKLQIRYVHRPMMHDKMHKINIRFLNIRIKFNSWPMFVIYIRSFCRPHLWKWRLQLLRTLHTIHLCPLCLLPLQVLLRHVTSTVLEVSDGSQDILLSFDLVCCFSQDCKE